MGIEKNRSRSKVRVDNRGLVISNIPQRTSWDLDYNVKLAQIAEQNGFDYALSQRPRGRDIEMKRSQSLLDRLRTCRACESNLPLGPRPIVQAHPAARLLIVGQAPGLKVHQTGIPWNDASGDRLRAWLGLSTDEFYDPELVAVIPIGFCYPGRGKSGDLPPRKECFELWHRDLRSYLKNVRLTMLVGHYAQNKYLKEKAKLTATETIREWRSYLPAYVPLPHPSPRNNIWLHKNPWFERTALPEIRAVLRKIR